MPKKIEHKLKTKKQQSHPVQDVGTRVDHNDGYVLAAKFKQVYINEKGEIDFRVQSPNLDAMAVEKDKEYALGRPSQKLDPKNYVGKSKLPQAKKGKK
jgi:hypothetical protein